MFEETFCENKTNIYGNKNYFCKKICKQKYYIYLNKKVFKNPKKFKNAKQKV